MHFITNEKGLKYYKNPSVIPNSFQKILSLIAQPKLLEKNKAKYKPVTDERLLVIKCQEFHEGESVVEYYALSKANTSSFLTPIKITQCIKKIPYRATIRKKELSPLKIQLEESHWKLKKIKKLKAVKRFLFLASKNRYKKNRLYQEGVTKQTNKKLQNHPKLLEYKSNKHLFFVYFNQDKKEAIANTFICN